MRIQVAGSLLAGRLLALTAGVVVAVAVAMGGAAWAAPIPDRSYSESSAPQPAPVVSERSYTEAPAGASEPADAAPLVAADTAVTPAAPTDDGLGAFVIAAIVLGGVAALCAAAYTARRVAHHGHAAH